MLKDRLFFISGKLIAAAILAGIALLVVILASGRDLPFISKEEQDYSSYRTDSEPDSDVSQPEAVSEEVSQSSTSEPSAEPSSYDRAVSSFEKIHPQTPSYDIYDPALHSLKLVDTSSYQGMDGGSVTLTMGYIITEKNGETHIYSPDGRDITATVGDRTLTVLRDKEGRPLFISDSGVYYYLDDAGALVISDYDSKLDKRAFDCEYPRYLGVQNDTIFRYRDGNMYGYKTKGYVVITAMFREVFAFSDEGVGCVLWKHAGGENLIFYNSKAVTINMEYLPSADRSANALGYYYFDDGLMRVRRQNADKTYSEILITSDAKPVSLPSDYSLVSYTDSRILLSKNGRYGFMSSRFEWVTLPEYTSAKPFYEGLAVVSDSSGKYGVIDRSGDTVVPFVFDYISDCSDGVLLAYEKEHGWTVFEKTAVNP